jgi:uncharacterized protein YkwD
VTDVKQPANAPLDESEATPSIITPFSIDSGITSPDLLEENPAPHPPNVADLKALMLDLINSDRAAAGLSPVAWDDTAALAGQLHAEDMAGHNFFSHWNMAGYGPDYRYSAAGGLDTTAENIHTTFRRFDDGRPAQIDNWEEVIKEAEVGLMNSSGHRRNILDPAHTHVGIGLAYNPDLGQVWLTQEFVNRYVRLQSLPSSLPLGGTHRLQGQLLPGASDPLINLAYEPFPPSMSKADLEATSTYISPAGIFQPINPAVNADGSFTADLLFDYEGKPGLYHVQVWVTVEGQREKVMTSDVVVILKE